MARVMSKNGSPFLVPDGKRAWAESNGFRFIRPATPEEEALHLERSTSMATVDEMLSQPKVEDAQGHPAQDVEEAPQVIEKEAPKVQPKRKRRVRKRKVVTQATTEGGKE